jgi:hypothetical protein
VPDGAVIFNLPPGGAEVPALGSAGAFAKMKLKGMMLKRRYLETGRDCGHLAVLEEAEALINREWGPCGISPFSRRILTRANWSQIARKRRENYWILWNELKDISPIRPVMALAPNQTPIGFVVKAKNRNELREYLKKNRVYCPVYWPTPEELFGFPKARAISETIISIPCDQRYSGSALLDVASLIKAFYQ